ncbi:MAG: trypsin-like peptidase domain-containing protein [bacterium]|nr:trypsin-like peptidase domain-containing protein [bacterium]
MELRVRVYKDIHHLSPGEKFCLQSVAAGPLCSGFLITEDIVVTSAHFANKKNVTDLCFLFDYRLEAPGTVPCTRFPGENVYYGSQIIHRERVGMGPATTSDWALVKLDRKVKGRKIAVLSDVPVRAGDSVYCIGFPCGLAAKYAPGSSAFNLTETSFMTKLDLYPGTSGAPIFSSSTNKILGTVARVDKQDFRLLDDGFVSVNYPCEDITSHGDVCTSLSAFRNYCRPLPGGRP